MLYLTWYFLLIRYVDQLTDLGQEYVKVRHSTDEIHKKELETKLENEIMPAYLKQFEDKVAKGSSGFLIGDSLTLADLYFVCLTDWLGEKKKVALANFPKLQTLDEKVRSIPKLAEWIAKRPVTSI